VLFLVPVDWFGLIFSEVMEESILASAKVFVFQSCCFIRRRYVSTFRAGIDVALNAPPIILAAFA
jgi:hypothetical protein